MIDQRLKTLRIFANCGTVAATAELTGYSPSAVSAQLRELQRSLGMQLLSKEGRGVRLTAAGRQLVRGADKLVSEWELLRSSALNADDQVPAHLGLGGFSTAAAHLLAPLAQNLRVNRPSVEVELVEAHPEQCLNLLVAERIDLAVIVAAHAGLQSDEDPKFEQVTLLNDPLDVIVPNDHPLAGRSHLHLEELAGEPWITDSEGSVYRALFTAAFAAIGQMPRIAHQAKEWETMSAFVGAGLGVGLLPRLAVLNGLEGVSRVRLAGANHPTRRIVAAVRRGSMGAPLIRESLEFLQSEASRILKVRLAEGG
ncbi:LysR family transcriptional regulator [Glutamicibacter sp.]|uniref:LysR family transcriptional regulator n=1 Tax=Glutamicibacter sp. TaxID=1931995 RepID=UPI0028BDC635|nr:LysR family transcriptional regulator [Glutamicibacter sp.]